MWGGQWIFLRGTIFLAGMGSCPKPHCYVSEPQWKICCMTEWLYTTKKAQSSSGATVGSHAFPIAGPKTWNALSEDVTPSHSEYTFHRQLKTWLFKKSFPDIITDWQLVCSNLRRFWRLRITIWCDTLEQFSSTLSSNKNACFSSSHKNDVQYRTAQSDNDGDIQHVFCLFYYLSFLCGRLSWLPDSFPRI